MVVPERRTLYHQTPLKNLESILRYGIKKHDGCVYLCDSPDGCKLWLATRGRSEDVAIIPVYLNDFDWYSVTTSTFLQAFKDGKPLCIRLYEFYGDIGANKIETDKSKIHIGNSMEGLLKYTLGYEMPTYPCEDYIRGVLG